MQNRAFTPIKFLYLEFSSNHPLEYRHLIVGDENIPALQKNNALLIGLCREGAGVLLMEEKIYSFSADHIVIIPAGTTYCIHSPKSTKSRWELLLIGEQFSPALLPGQPIIRNEQAARTLLMLLEEWYQSQAHSQQAQHLLLELLFLQLMRSTEMDSKNTGETPLSPPQRRAMEAVHPALGRISTGFSEKITVEQLAEMCHLSCAQFQRTFHIATGQSPHAYLISLRIKMAAALLRSTDLSILNIAQRVGFDCLSSFNRHFLRIHGRSPREYRVQSHTPSLPAKKQFRGDAS